MQTQLLPAPGELWEHICSALLSEKYFRVLELLTV